ncbi:MAG: inner membrane CreD family protein, partial [Planctomycetota bacterium]
AVWRYERLLPAQNRVIGIVMPARPSAGALAARISQFAPVSLFFFLTVMITIQLIRNLRLHPINYLLIAAGFFAFHILLGYLADHLTIHLAFWVSAAVSVFLVVSYLRLVLGMKTAILIAGAAQMVYLVFFSYAFFWQGWTGLTVVIGAITTLFLIMQLTGRIDWNTLFPDVARQARVETA